jgi:Family of unknown function (DUF6247)
MAVSSIRRPREFTFPASEEAIDRMFEQLGEEDLRKFATEWVAAMEAARTKDDLLPVRQMLEAWYRASLLRRDPEHPQLTKEAHDRAAGKVPPGIKGQTVEELRDDIRRRRAS